MAEPWTHDYQLCANEDHSRTCFCCNECGGHEDQHIPHEYVPDQHMRASTICAVCDLSPDDPIHGGANSQ